MKGCRDKGCVPQKQIPKYELLKQQVILKNVQAMKAMGQEIIARKIFLDNAQIHVANAREEDMISDDDDYQPDEENDVDENDICERNESHTKAKQLATQSSTKLGTMGEYVKQPCQKQRLQDQVQSSTKEAKVSCNMKQPMRRLEFENHLQPQSKHVPNQAIEKQGQTQQFVKNQSQKKQKQRNFITSGALSHCAKLRQKQHGKVNVNNDLELDGNIDAPLEDQALENQIVDYDNANQGALECRLQIRGNSEELVDDVQANVHGTDALDMNELEMGDEEGHAKEALTIKKHRGPTKLAHAHARTTEERPMIVLNKYGQPIGPTKEIVQEFSRFLGTIAKDSELAPLNYWRWPMLPTHESIWAYILQKYMVAEEGRKWVMGTIGYLWLMHKSRVKEKHYKTHDTDEERWKWRPTTISEPQFADLLNYWACSPEQSKKNKKSRELANYMHTMGPRSYAMLRHKLEEEDPQKQEPSQAKVYIASRQRDPKKAYKTDYVKIKGNIDKMESLASQEQDDGSHSNDPYYDVITKAQHSGRVPLFGHGVTKTDLKKKGKNSGYILPKEFVQRIGAEAIKKTPRS